MTAGHREYPPYISYAIATLMSVSMLALQATLPFKLQTLGAIEKIRAEDREVCFDLLLHVTTGCGSFLAGEFEVVRIHDDADKVDPLE